jgi:hypothetical protein
LPSRTAAAPVSVRPRAQRPPPFSVPVARARATSSRRSTPAAWRWTRSSWSTSPAEDES